MFFTHETWHRMRWPESVGDRWPRWLNEPSRVHFSDSAALGINQTTSGINQRNSRNGGVCCGAQVLNWACGCESRGMPDVWGSTLILATDARSHALAVSSGFHALHPAMLDHAMAEAPNATKQGERSRESRKGMEKRRRGLFGQPCGLSRW